MRVEDVLKKISKTAGDIASGALDVGMTGAAKFEGVTDGIGESVTKKLIKKSGDALFDESVTGTKREIAKKIYNNSTRIGNTIGASTEGLIAGSTSGALIGGISGAIDEDETALEGATRGALIGGALGGVGGATSGFFHKNSGLLENAQMDAEIVSKRIAKWRTGQGS